MQLNIRTPRQSLNKAFLKVKPNRDDIERFKSNFIKLLDIINETESEEFHKNLVSEFLKDTYYKKNYFINTKGRNDLVIHNGKDAQNTVGVIIETKKPGNRSEMVRRDNINVKAFQELLLYYLRERITLKNLEIKYLIATDIYEWFIFDAQLFERLFANDKQLIKKFNNFEEKRLSDTRTDFFYKEIADPFINAIETEITFTHFDIRNYEKPLRNADKQDDNKFIALFKLLSPEHLLKLPFANDSNSLDKSFYTELLHIIGLAETKEGGKKLIGRKKEGERDAGSLIESAIVQLDSLDKISRFENANRYGSTNDERLFNIALELSITWINRILFLKLLEAQLLNYNNGDKSFSFLSTEKIKNFDDLNNLFFQVLARKPEERTAPIKKIFSKVPYLNSSLFEPTEIEHQGLFISQIKDTHLRIINATVLKDKTGKKRSGSLATLEYIFEFLDAYDFGGDGAEEIQEDNKTLINASVLGLIFEKINGYKDGSFFTPGFITMYMCRETIRRAVIQKFNDVKKWKCQDIEQLYDKIEDRQDANQIINSLKICDPAVGSGHFLVSALNEIIAIKNDVKILLDRNGRRLKEYSVEVVSDELIVTDEDGKIFEYNPRNKESQRVQEALFHEKQTIIENCLFGVDINPNSVKICRLRLWIELLKNAYYKAPAFTELETLPNIDINIKCGNSLISRYPLDADIKEALQKSKWSIDSYRLAVMTYRNAENKEQKQAMEKLIKEIKSDFESEVIFYDKRIVRLRNAKDELKTLIQQTPMFELSKKQKADLEKKLKKLTAEIKKLEIELEETKNNKIYENAFEWRFEFPEVLNDNGNFVGFDVAIGNPPYVYRNADIEPYKNYFNSNYYNNSGNFDLYKYFIEKAISIVRTNFFHSFITNSSFILQSSFEKTRQILLENTALLILAPLGPNVFEEATVDSSIYILKKSIVDNNKIEIIVPAQITQIQNTNAYTIQQKRFYKNKSFVFDYLLRDAGYKIIQRLFEKFQNIEHGYEFGVGINTGYIKSEMVGTAKIDERYHPMVPGSGISRYGIPKPDGFIMYDKEFVKGKGDRGRALPDEKFFSNPKILVVRTRNVSLKQRIIATIDYDKFYNLNRLSNIISRGTYSLEGLLGVLNSRLFNWIYSVRFLDYEIKPIYLRNTPLCDTNNPDLIDLVKKILVTKKQNPNADTNTLEEEIDKLVYQLYDLTKEEIQIIEQAHPENN